jgi:hypothetical protein
MPSHDYELLSGDRLVYSGRVLTLIACDRSIWVGWENPAGRIVYKDCEIIADDIKTGRAAQEHGGLNGKRV